MTGPRRQDGPAAGRAASPLFEFTDVVVRLGEITALDGVTVAIPDGGVTAIVGPSGSGKSTLLRLCNRLEVAERGRIAYRGRPLEERDPRALRREVGMVFQQPTLVAGTVGDNLALADPGADDAVRRGALARVALDADLLTRDAGALSGGEAQRVCLARTLLTRPAVLLLDEPTAALDAAPTRAFERTVAALAEDGIPALWVTHDLPQLRRVADAVVVLDAGRVVAAFGDAAEAAGHAALVRLLEPEGDHGRR